MASNVAAAPAREAASMRTAPRPGMRVRVRNRIASVEALEGFEAGSARWHVVRLRYEDGERPADARVLWEVEAGQARTLPLLPDPLGTLPAAADRVREFVRTLRRTSAGPLPGLPGHREVAAASSGLPLVTAPLRADARLEEFQLVPLLLAAEQPRVRLLLADDVGLGKTIEAGLIASELLLRRRIRRVLVLCPPALREQWQRELADRFGLRFVIVDREEARQGRAGLETPWAVCDRVIASPYYLRRPEVRAEFIAAGTGADTPASPWDLLIVDEAHHLLPAAAGPESGLARMLREIAPWFEHRVFLTATPHNGFRRSFTGLLEILDPVAFRQTALPTPGERQEMARVVVRRTKAAVNRETSPHPFRSRRVEAVPLRFTPDERELFTAFRALRNSLSLWARSARPAAAVNARFAAELLGKRLLSSLPAFAVSFAAFCEGLARAAASPHRAGPLPSCPDDEEAERLWQAAAVAVGGLLAGWHAAGTARVARVSGALARLGLLDASGRALGRPRHDTRGAAWLEWVREQVAPDRADGQGERALVFTEYKATLDYLERCLKERWPHAGDRTVRIFGAMAEPARRAAVDAFCAAASPVRLLLATDAAGEGLNLQRQARLLFHFDIPWNPARIDQRNGRLDRHDQARDVTITHFAAEEELELRFLSRLLRKVERMRDDLGMVAPVLSEEVTRRLAGHTSRCRENARLPFRHAVDPAAGSTASPDRAALPVCSQIRVPGLPAVLDHARRLLHLDPDALSQTVAVAASSARPPRPMAHGSGPMARRALALHAVHPLFRWAEAETERAGWEGSRWSLEEAELPPEVAAEAALWVRTRVIADAGCVVHDWLAALRLHLGWNGRVNLAASRDREPSGRAGPADGLALARARRVWRLCLPQVTGTLTRLQAAFEARVPARLAQERRRQEEETRALFRRRREEVERAAGALAVRRLRARAERLGQERRCRGYLFSELRQEADAELAELSRELAGGERRRQRLLERLESEERVRLETWIPRRFTCSTRPWFHVEAMTLTLALRKGAMP